MAQPFIGQILTFAGTFAPVGYLPCNGQSLPISQNEVLYNLIGTIYGGDGVTTFNFHLHLPHYAVTSADQTSIHVLTRQPVDRERPHPFSDAGNTEFNTCLWMPPKGERAGHIVMADSTVFTTLFGGTDSLMNFWRNLARM